MCSSCELIQPSLRAADELKKKKKKRKREGESDGETGIFLFLSEQYLCWTVYRISAASQDVATCGQCIYACATSKASKAGHLNHTVSLQGLHLAALAYVATLTISRVVLQATTGPDFSLPSAHPMPLLPPRPPIPPPPIPGPSKPTDVMEDFSKAKPPAQVLVTTFYSSIEPYIRNIKEEDVGFLEYTGDEVEPYVMPKLGRHYLDIWEDQDAGVLPPVILGDQPAPSNTFTAPTPKWDPSTMAEADLVAEEKGHGPLTERVISALLPIPDSGGWKGVKAAEDAMEGRPGGSGAAAARRERLNVTDLEARIRDTMRYHGLLDIAVCFLLLRLCLI